MTYKSKNTTQSYDVSEGESIGLYVENMGNSEVTVNSYDGFNQLTKTQIGNMNITYAYNGEGRRVEKTVNSSTTRYLYEFDKVVLEIDGTGKETGRNVYGTNLLMRKSGSDKLYYMYNGHADVTALIDASTGVVRGSYYYDAFGNILEQKYYTTSGVETTEKINNSITYAGYQYDEETGLYYLNARMYDPKVARFLQEDTYRGSASDPLSLNLYTYCSNNPIIYWDPTGHWQQGDSDRDPLVQLALMTLSDEWNEAKAANDKEGMKKAAETANKVRKEGLKHNIIVSNFYGSFSDQQMEVLKNLEVVDKGIEAKAFENGVSLAEWTEMRKVAFIDKDPDERYKVYKAYVKGYYEPIPIYTGIGRNMPITDDFNSASFISGVVANNTYTTVEAFTRIVSEGFRLAGRRDAADNWDHYVNGSGATKPVDFKRMNDEMWQAGEFREVAKNDMKVAATLLVNPNGREVSISSLFEEIREPENTGMFDNWYLAIGNYRTFTNATVSAKYNWDGSISYTADMLYNIRDNYKWYDKNLERTLKDLHRLGLAQEYKLEGVDYIKDISWSKACYPWNH
ncbi:MAG: tRNA(Glu)-specific nuclease WapA precursor [Firmicutes bacterium ADurb.Bin419]|nr:MAG: tRNA(Glu)-specific nuclease WapA precursor [Firmicutes bacterium ADurb.Bin419]